MKAVRVYKDNLREHIFRTMFFTDTVIFCGFGILLAVFTIILFRFVLHVNQVGLIFSTIFLGELFYAIVATQKIDKQPVYTIIPRTVTFLINKKRYAKQELTKTIGDFTLVGNYILRKKKLLAVFEIRPFDIALLNDEERERYYQHIKTMLHTLPGAVQLISRKQKAKVTDYNNHFLSFYETANEKLNWLIEKYTQELSSLIENNTFQMMKYYAVFATPLVSQDDKEFVAASQKLADMIKRFSSALALERIQTIQLTHEELIAYFQNQFRNDL